MVNAIVVFIMFLGIVAMTPIIPYFLKVIGKAKKAPKSNYNPKLSYSQNLYVAMNKSNIARKTAKA